MCDQEATDRSSHNLYLKLNVYQEVTVLGNLATSDSDCEVGQRAGWELGEARNAMTHQARALFFRLIRLPICQEILEGSPAQDLGVVEGELQHCVDSVAIKMGFIRHPAPHANVFISLWRNQRNMSEVFHKLNLFVFQYDCHFFPSWGKSYKAVASLLSRCENMRSLLKRDSDCTRAEPLSIYTWQSVRPGTL